MKLRVLTPGMPAAGFFPLLLACAVAGPALPAQQLIGYVNTHDADTTGASDRMDGQAVLTGSVGVTAKDHTAPITLGRGGAVRVCQTSVLHLTQSKSAAVPAPLLFSLDRGAIEIQTDSTANDSIMTPDLRFSVQTTGPLDLRLRIARNGDTCVDNRGPGAPTLAVSDLFGESMYEIGPNQHLLFEHASLREVVDNETLSCGCPDEKGVSLADALLALPGAKLGGKSAVAAPAPVPAAPAPAAPAAAAPVASAVAAAPAAALPPPVVAPPAPAPVAAASPASTPAAVVAPMPAAAVAALASPATAVVPATAAVQPAGPSVGQAAGASSPAVVSSAPSPATPAEQAAAEQAAERAVEQAAAEAAARAAALHPFPEAVSEGLAPGMEAPPSAGGEGAAQLQTGLAYNAPVPVTSAPAGPVAPAAPPAAPVDAKPPAPVPHGFGHAIGHFFRKLFGG